MMNLEWRMEVNACITIRWRPHHHAHVGPAEYGCRILVHEGGNMQVMCAAETYFTLELDMRGVDAER
jgi:hypothetical protein